MDKGTILDQIDIALNEIQGNILAGFNKDFQTFVFLQFYDREGARDWLRSITPEVASCDEVDTFNTLFKELNSRRGGELGILKVTWTNLAFTFKGLDFLGAGDAAFPDDFKSGMRARAALIGDVDDSDPADWVDPFSGSAGQELHAVLMLASDTQPDLHQHLMRYLKNIYENGSIRILLVQEGATRADQPGHEHFGFKDGVSQPGIKGFTASVNPAGPNDPHQGAPGQDLLWPGEFVLGYPTQIDQAKPGFDGPNPDPGPLSQNGPEWSKNGSYLVFRRLRQDVEGFHASVKANAPDGMSEEVFGAKLVGRYASGCPLELTKDETAANGFPAGFDPTAEDPSLADPELLDELHDNNFEYGEDAQGINVPRSAHIRKAYPRDEVLLEADGTPDPNSPLNESFTQTHRVLRRGIPFGTSFRPSLGAQKHALAGEAADRGLLFLCYQKSIQSQFEFVQQTWVNNPDFPQAGDGQDPVIAQSTQGPFRCPMHKGKPLQLNLNHFVTTTGGDYFFQPSISALKMLGGNKA